MTLFDLLFILLFLASVGTLLSAVFLALRGRGRRSLVLLRTWCICAGAYFAVVVVTSLFWPRTELQAGEPRCFDDWCMAVEKVTTQPSGPGLTYTIALRISSRALRVPQREEGVTIYLEDKNGRRFNPLPRPSAMPFDVLLQPGQSVTAERVFEISQDAREPGLVVTHEGGFQMGWVIIGYETWFRKPAIIRLTATK